MVRPRKDGFTRWLLGLCCLLLVVVGCSDGAPTSSTTSTTAVQTTTNTSGGAGTSGAPSASSGSVSTAAATVTSASVASPNIVCRPFGDTNTKSAHYSPTTGAEPPGLFGAIVRLGEHQSECYERFTIEFGGTGAFPSWRVGYKAGPIVAPTSQQPVVIVGNAFLVVTVDAWMFPEASRAQPGYVASADQDVIREARLIENFESVQHWVLGLAEQRGFTVTEMTEPPRLVIDVYDAA